MATRKQILNNPTAFSDEELAAAIRSGEVTVYELSKTGCLTPLRRRSIERAMTAPAPEVAVQPEAHDVPVPEIPAVPEIPPLPTQPASASEPVKTQFAPPPVPSEPTVTPQKPAEQFLVINGGASVSEMPVLNGNNVQTPPPIPDIPPIPAVTSAPKTPPTPPAEAYNTADSYYHTGDDAPSDDFVIVNGGMFRHPFSFRGRIARLEYFLTFLIGVVCNIGCSLLVTSWPTPEALGIALVVQIVLLFFLLAQTAKRCHDRNNSGWFQLIPFYNIFLLFAPGVPEINKYGTDPSDN